jgi:hypothetical protein
MFALADRLVRADRPAYVAMLHGSSIFGDNMVLQARAVRRGATLLPRSCMSWHRSGTVRLFRIRRAAHGTATGATALGEDLALHSRIPRRRLAFSSRNMPARLRRTAPPSPHAKREANSLAGHLRLCGRDRMPARGTRPKPRTRAPSPGADLPLRGGGGSTDQRITSPRRTRNPRRPARPSP